nr:hypothetical protein [Bacteroidota bacterium]
MRKRNFTLIPVLLIVALSFSNCEKTEDIVDFPVLDPTLVLKCYFSPYAIGSLCVSKSLSVIDTS